MEMRPLPGKFPQSRAKIEYFCVHVHDCNAFSCWRVIAALPNQMAFIPALIRNGRLIWHLLPLEGEIILSEWKLTPSIITVTVLKICIGINVVFHFVNISFQAISAVSSRIPRLCIHLPKQHLLMAKIIWPRIRLFALSRRLHWTKPQEAQEWNLSANLERLQQRCSCLTVKLCICGSDCRWKCWQIKNWNR